MSARARDGNSATTATSQLDNKAVDMVQKTLFDAGQRTRKPPKGSTPYAVGSGPHGETCGSCAQDTPGASGRVCWHMLMMQEWQEGPELPYRNDPARIQEEWAACLGWRPLDDVVRVVIEGFEWNHSMDEALCERLYEGTTFERSKEGLAVFADWLEETEDPRAELARKLLQTDFLGLGDRTVGKTP